MIVEMLFAVRDGLQSGDIALDLLTHISVPLSDHTVLESDIIITDKAKGQGLLPLEGAKLVIEISSSTLAIDFGRKADLYANACVPEYWVVDINENRVLVHANPSPDGSGYDGQLDVLFGEPLHAATIEGLTVETHGLA